VSYQRSSKRHRRRARGTYRDVNARDRRGGRRL